MIIEGREYVRVQHARCGWLPLLCCALWTICLASSAQESSLPDAPTPQESPFRPVPSRQDSKGQYDEHHILWIIPNYRSDDSKSQIQPLAPRRKFELAFEDSFDPSAFLVAGFFAGTAMAQDQHHSFGQGTEGFAKYYGGAFADQAIGNFMTEALLPSALHQDPRYFNKGSGGFWPRTAYAISREVVTRSDDGRNVVNTSELVGNAIAAGISNAYYPAADRTAGKTLDKWGQQLGVDTAFNIMKEFWPDIRHRLFGK